MCRGKSRIYINCLLELFDGLIVASRNVKFGSQIRGFIRRTWIKLLPPLRLGDGFVMPAHPREISHIILLSRFRVWIQFDGAFEFSFGSFPIAIILLEPCQCGVSLCELAIKF